MGFARPPGDPINHKPNVGHRGTPWDTEGQAIHLTSSPKALMAPCTGRALGKAADAGQGIWAMNQSDAMERINTNGEINGEINGKT